MNVDSLFDALLNVEAAWRTDDTVDVDEVVALWLELGHAHRILGDLVKAVGDDAAGRLLDREDPAADYVTTVGDVVHLAPGYAPERWRGHDVIAELCEVLVEPSTGEQVPAVPVSVLVDVLPGCGTPELTSSKWRTTGLGRYLPDWRRYRSRDDAPLVIKRGPAR